MYLFYFLKQKPFLVNSFRLQSVWPLSVCLMIRWVQFHCSVSVSLFWPFLYFSFLFLTAFYYHEFWDIIKVEKFLFLNGYFNLHLFTSSHLFLPTTTKHFKMKKENCLRTARRIRTPTSRRCPPRMLLLLPRPSTLTTLWYWGIHTTRHR